MAEKFVVKHKKTDEYVVTTIRMEKELQEEYEKLSSNSGRSRNELMCMALRYALENLEFIPKDMQE